MRFYSRNKIVFTFISVGKQTTLVSFFLKILILFPIYKQDIIGMSISGRFIF